MISPKEFVERWEKAELREQQAAQSHFNELCRLVNQKTPTERDPKGEFFTFEQHVTKEGGRADGWDDLTGRLLAENQRRAAGQA